MKSTKLILDYWEISRRLEKQMLQRCFFYSNNNKDKVLQLITSCLKRISAKYIFTSNSEIFRNIHKASYIYVCIWIISGKVLREKTTPWIVRQAEFYSVPIWMYYVDTKAMRKSKFKTHNLLNEFVYLLQRLHINNVSLPIRISLCPMWQAL